MRARMRPPSSCASCASTHAAPPSWVRTSARTVTPAPSPADYEYCAKIAAHCRLGRRSTSLNKHLGLRDLQSVDHLRPILP